MLREPAQPPLRMKGPDPPFTVSRADWRRRPAWRGPGTGMRVGSRPGRARGRGATVRRRL